jgi:hypothetical protein
MATVQIRSFKKYAKAIGLLFEIGGFFWTRPWRKLVLNPYQIQCLQDAGLLPKPKKKRGQKEVRFPPHSDVCPLFPFGPMRMHFPALARKSSPRDDGDNAKSS